jgi:nucleoside-diphosphate-sugar epimerase
MKDFWSEKKVLITGGAGYLAFGLLQLLSDRSASIVRLVRPGTLLAPSPGDAEVLEVHADIREPTVWDALLEGVDVIFHLAAQTSAAAAEADPVEDLSTNVLPLVSLLEACRRVKSAPTVLFAGTATECGLTDSIPVNETMADQPVTTYDLHKLMAENYLKYYTRQGAVHGATLRLGNVYGPGPRNNTADRGILNLMVRRALGGDALTVYGTGDYLRDYVFVEDVASAFVAAAENIDAVNGGHYLVGSGKGNTVAEAVQLVAERVASRKGVEVDVKHVELPKTLSPIDTRNFVADTGLFQARTGWRARVSLTEGIDRTIRYYTEEMR